jgi:hypothetical protein
MQALVLSLLLLIADNTRVVSNISPFLVSQDQNGAFRSRRAVSRPGHQFSPNADEGKVRNKLNGLPNQDL